MLVVFIEELKEDYGPFVANTTDLILPLVNYVSNENVRKSAANCLPCLIACVKTSNVEEACRITKSFLVTLWT
jgi:hypothetical protein